MFNFDWGGVIKGLVLIVDIFLISCLVNGMMLFFGVLGIIGVIVMLYNLYLYLVIL